MKPAGDGLRQTPVALRDTARAREPARRQPAVHARELGLRFARTR
jgi:hypothetical protein